MNKKQEEKIRELLLNSTPVDIYKMVLDGTLKRFPLGFWSMPENYDYARACIKYLLEKVLKLDMPREYRKVSNKTFTDNKLRGMLDMVYEGSCNRAIMDAYNEIKPYMLNVVSKGYWDKKENMLEATKWLIEKKLNMTPEVAYIELKEHHFLEEKLRYILDAYEGTIQQMVKEIYPEIDFDEKRDCRGNLMPNEVDTEEKVIRYIKRILDKEYSIKNKEDRIKLHSVTSKQLKELKVLHQLSKLGNNIYESLGKVYGELPFEPWEMITGAPAKYWRCRSNRERAIVWFYANNLYHKENFRKQLKRYKLYNMVYNYYKIEDLYKTYIKEKDKYRGKIKRCIS